MNHASNETKRKAQPQRGRASHGQREGDRAPTARGWLMGASRGLLFATEQISAKATEVFNGRIRDSTLVKLFEPVLRYPGVVGQHRAGLVGKPLLQQLLGIGNDLFEVIHPQIVFSYFPSPQPNTCDQT